MWRFFITFIGGAFLIPQGVSYAVRKLFGPPMQSDIDALAFSKAKQQLREHEGYRRDAYLDSVGVLTVGIGHKVLLSDNIRRGQVISDAQVEEFFRRDVDRAFAAARAQAQELRKYTPDMIAALTSVNFQLGTGWRSKFGNTWNDLKNDNIQSAIVRLNSSAWARQTPVRVASFIDTLREVYG